MASRVYSQPSGKVQGQFKRTDDKSTFTLENIKDMINFGDPIKTENGISILGKYTLVKILKV